MSRLIQLIILAALLSPTMFVRGSAATNPIQKFDEFGDTNCENEMARLDNFAVSLLGDPASKGLIIFYGGRRLRGRRPKRGEAAARVARLKPYLVERRGVPADQVTVINGGYTSEYRVELWIVAPGASPPAPHPTIPANRIKFRKGRLNPRDYRCRV
jgi:hypothetical protein